MSQYSILPQFNTVTSDGIIYTVQMSSDPKFENIHAIQIDGDKIHVEFIDGTPVKWDAKISDYQDVIDKVEQLKHIIPTLTFEEVKKKTLDTINTGFISQLSHGFMTNGILMGTSLMDIQNLLTSSQLATTLSQPILDIIDFNNVVHPNIPIDVVHNMIVELGKNYQTVLTKKQTLLSTINSATTIEELQKIVW